MLLSLILHSGVRPRDSEQEAEPANELGSDDDDDEDDEEDDEEDNMWWAEGAAGASPPLPLAEANRTAEAIDADAAGGGGATGDVKGSEVSGDLMT